MCDSSYATRKFGSKIGTRVGLLVAFRNRKTFSCQESQHFRNRFPPVALPRIGSLNAPERVALPNLTVLNPTQPGGHREDDPIFRKLDRKRKHALETSLFRRAYVTLMSGENLACKTPEWLILLGGCVFILML